MSIKFIQRLTLLLVLVFAQALYAGHAVGHAGGVSVADCSTCLQASSDETLVPAQAYLNTNIETPLVCIRFTQTLLCGKSKLTRHSRAPPVSCN